MSTLTFKNLETVKNKIARAAIVEVSNILQDHWATVLEERIQQIFLRELGRNQTILGLTGFFAGDEDRDIQAIFGVENSVVEESIKDMRQAVESGLKIELNFIVKGTSLNYEVTLSYEDITVYILGSPSSTYTYEHIETQFFGGRKETDNFDITIPWMDWLINGASTEAGLHYGKLKRHYSRTGRAVMSTIESGGWNWDGIDFVEKVAYSKRFTGQVQTAIRNTIKQQIVKNIGTS